MYLHAMELNVCGRFNEVNSMYGSEAAELLKPEQKRPRAAVSGRGREGYSWRRKLLLPIDLWYTTHKYVRGEGDY